MSSQIVFMDLGGISSFCSSLLTASLCARAQENPCFFITTRENILRSSKSEEVQLIDIDDIENKIDYLKKSLVIDFTEPGKGVSKTVLLFQESYNFYLQQDHSFSQNSFFEKIEYVETLIEQRGLLEYLQPIVESPVLTYSPEFAARLNLQGIPTIELCYRFKKPGSFLPQSLVIFGDTFSLLRKDEIQLIFEFYQNGKIDDLFLNKNVLEIDWDLLYYKMDRRNNAILVKKYPISPTEAFLDLFLRSFLSQPLTQAYSIETVMEKAQKLDTIDLEMTLEFLRKTLQRCVVDIDKKRHPFTQSHWNWVRPYIDCYSKDKLTDLKKILHQALMGLDLFLRIQERQKRVVGMH
jgi:hypothetical protein